MGRPSKYNPLFCEQARKLCELGATDVELADFFGVSDRTVYRWQGEYAEFRQALKAGKEGADDRVERSLYHKAVGYTFDSEKVFQYQGQIVRAQTREHVPPDTTAAIFWLKNRRADQWRDKHDIAFEELGDFSGSELRELSVAIRRLKAGRAGATAGSGVEEETRH